jgi:hypothetical protein
MNSIVNEEPGLDTDKVGTTAPSLENCRDPLTAADAYRHQRTLASGAGQLVERFDRQNGAGGLAI